MGRFLTICNFPERIPNMIKRGICLILTLVLMLGMLPGNAGAQEMTGSLTAYDALAEVLTYLYGIDLTVGSTRGEWAVLAMARGELLEGTEEKALAYEQTALAAVSEGKLRQPTDYARVVLALTSLGKEAPTDALTHCQDFDDAWEQGINAVTYCLIALDTKPYAPDNTAIREQYLTYLLEHACPGGGWVYGDVTDAEADADMTAMVLQALTPYRDRADVGTAIEAALAALADMQEEDGAFGTYGLVNAESTAQVIVALSGLGLDPASWNGHDAIGALLKFYDRESSRFLHQLGGIPDQMATEQAAYALVAYARQQAGKANLYDMQELFSGGAETAQELVDRTVRTIENLGPQTVPMTRVNTREQVAAYVQERIGQLGITGVEWTVETTRFTPAEAGTEQSPDGRPGSFAVEVSVFLTGATAGSVTVSGTITPTVYAPQTGTAEAVDALIAQIGTVSDTPECRERITEARKAFDALSREEQEKVTGLSILLAAEETYAAWEAAEEAVEDAAKTIEALGTQTVTMATANTEAAVLRYVKTRIKLLDLSGTSCDAKVTAFTAATAGTAASPNGTPGSFAVTVTIFMAGAASREQKITGVITPTKYTAPQTDITVTVTLLGDSLHGESPQPHGLARGGLTTWIAAMAVTLPGGSTVLDALTLAFDQYGVTMTNPGGNYISAVTYGGKTLGEFTNGKNSGWMYTLNGTHPNVGVAAQSVRNGDTIVFHYTDDYTYEEGGVNFGKPVTGTGKTTTVSTTTEAREEIGDAYVQTGDYLENLGTPTVGSVGGEWMVLGLARSGREVPGKDCYLQAAVEYIRQNIDENQRLHKAKSTDNARLILALTALGEDVTNVDGHDLLQGLGDLTYVKKQGNNGPIWALIALDSGNYPTSGTATRQALIREILDVQTADGGWTISGDQADADMTGMALQALAPYYGQDPQVTEAVERGLSCLSQMQDADGGFGTFSGNGRVATSESAAQVIVALAALGLDGDTDSRFVKNGRSVIDALLDYFVPGGGFRHVLDGEIDGMATEQAYYALTAYYRLLEGKTGLYDMTDVVDRGGDPVPEETAPTQTMPLSETEQTPIPWMQLLLVLVLGMGIGAGSVLTVVLVVCVVRKKHGSFEKTEGV